MTVTAPVVVRPQLGSGWRLWPEAALRCAGMPVEWVLELADGDVTSLLAHPEFGAAITWQNPGVATTWLPAPGEPADLSGYRRSVLARYAQRYCTKNDSIGFFGPVGWARVEPSAPDSVRADGGGGVERMLVHLEHWAVAALGAAWATDPVLGAEAPVRRHPAASRHAATADVPASVRLPGRTPLDLSDAEVGVLDALDGGCPVGTLDPEPLESLVRRGIVLRGFRIPVTAHPEHALRAAVERFADPSVRDDLLDRLDQLELAVAAVAEAARDPGRLRAALLRLEAGYVQIGGPPPRRHGDSSGAGRTLVYPDCRRSGDLVVGAPAIARLAEPLALLLTSARWLTCEVATAVEDRLGSDYARLAARGPVLLSDLQLAAAETLTGADGLVDGIEADFAARWSVVLADGADRPDGWRVDPDRARGMVEALFQADAPGWAAARNHSPDLLPIRTPDGVGWVLGELHVAMNTLESRFFHDLHDAPERLAEQSRADFACGRLVPCYPPDGRVDSRRYPPLASHVEDRYRYWSFGADHGPHPAARSTVLASTALTVTRDRAGRLVAGPPGEWAVPVVEFLGEFLSALVVNRFRLSGPESRRVLLGELVVIRRSWLLHPQDLPTGLRGQRGYHTQALVDLLADRGAPRQVFIRVPGQPKPCFVDTEVPLTVANFARLWIAAVERDPAGPPMTVTEMLPAPGELLLADDAGHYTSELRFVAVDPEVSADLTVALPRTET